MVTLSMLVLLSCKGPVEVYSAVRAGNPADTLDSDDRRSRELDVATLRAEIGMVPFRSGRGVIKTVQFEYNGMKLQPYVSGNFYDGAFTVIMLFANKGNAEYEIPVNGMTVHPFPENETSVATVSSEKSKNSPSEVSIERRSLSDWEKSVIGTESIRLSETSEDAGSRSRDLGLQINELFQNGESFVLSSDSHREIEGAPEVRSDEAFAVERGDCMRVIAFFDESVLVEEKGQLEVVFKRTDTNDSYKVVFVLEHTMNAKRFIY